VNAIITTAHTAHQLHHLHGYGIAHLARQWWAVYLPF